MTIRVKLMAYLRNKLPAGNAQVEVDSGATVSALLRKLDVADGHVHLVMVNGAQESNRARVLQEGDELVIFPPVAGG